MIRTQAVPLGVSTNGSTSKRDRDQRDADPDRRRVLLPAGERLVDHASGPVADTLAEQSLRPEHQHQDQHDEGEHVLVVAAEEAESGVLAAP